MVNAFLVSPFSLAPARGPAATFAVNLGAVRHQGQHSRTNFASRLNLRGVKNRILFYSAPEEATPGTLRAFVRRQRGRDSGAFHSLPASVSRDPCRYFILGNGEATSVCTSQHLTSAKPRKALFPRAEQLKKNHSECARRRNTVKYHSTRSAGKVSAHSSRQVESRSARMQPAQCSNTVPLPPVTPTRDMLSKASAGWCVLTRMLPATRR